MFEQVQYYAVVDDMSSRDQPAGVVRRVRHSGGQRDEAFGRDLRWGHTSLLYSAERGNLDNRLVEITEEEAERIVARIRVSVAGDKDLPFPGTPGIGVMTPRFGRVGKYVRPRWGGTVGLWSASVRVASLCAKRTGFPVLFAHDHGSAERAGVAGYSAGVGLVLPGLPGAGPGRVELRPAR